MWRRSGVRNNEWGLGIIQTPHLVSAPGRGFEPRLTDPELSRQAKSACLPLLLV